MNAIDGFPTDVQSPVVVSDRQGLVVRATAEDIARNYETISDLTEAKVRGMLQLGNMYSLTTNHRVFRPGKRIWSRSC